MKKDWSSKTLYWSLTILLVINVPQVQNKSIRSFMDELHLLLKNDTCKYPPKDTFDQAMVVKEINDQCQQAGNRPGSGNFCKYLPLASRLMCVPGTNPAEMTWMSLVESVKGDLKNLDAFCSALNTSIPVKSMHEDVEYLHNFTANTISPGCVQECTTKNKSSQNSKISSVCILILKAFQIIQSHETPQASSAHSAINAIQGSNSVVADESSSSPAGSQMSNNVEGLKVEDNKQEDKNPPNIKDLSSTLQTDSNGLLKTTNAIVEGGVANSPQVPKDTNGMSSAVMDSATSPRVDSSSKDSVHDNLQSEHSEDANKNTAGTSSQNEGIPSPALTKVDKDSHSESTVGSQKTKKNDEPSKNTAQVDSNGTNLLSDNNEHTDDNAAAGFNVSPGTNVSPGSNGKTSPATGVSSSNPQQTMTGGALENKSAKPDLAGGEDKSGETSLNGPNPKEQLTEAVSKPSTSTPQASTSSSSSTSSTKMPTAPENPKVVQPPVSKMSDLPGGPNSGEDETDVEETQVDEGIKDNDAAKQNSDNGKNQQPSNFFDLPVGNPRQENDRWESSNTRYKKYGEDEDVGFFNYFLTFVAICGIGWLIFHNKKRIIAMVVEGRRPSSTRQRRSSSGSYRKLENNFD